MVAQALNLAPVPTLLAFLGPLAVCTVAPVTSMALQYAHVFRLNEALAAGLVQSGTAISLLLMPFLGITATVSAAAGSLLPFTTAVGAAAVSVAMTSLIAAVNAMPSTRVTSNRVKMVYQGTTEAQGKQKGQQISASLGTESPTRVDGSPVNGAETSTAKQEQEQHYEETASEGSAEPQAPSSSPPPRRKSMFRDVGKEEGEGGTPPTPAAGAMRSRPIKERRFGGQAPLKLGFASRHPLSTPRILNSMLR